MSRCLIEINAQKRFLYDVCAVVGIQQAAAIAGICERVMYDWRQSKSTMRYEAAINLSNKSGVALPEIESILPDHWHVKEAAARGGIARCKMYGNPGTTDGRKRGGIVSQKKFREDPVYARELGVKIRKEIFLPAESELLAEFVGILLGDGGITAHQVRVTYNRTLDRPHALFVQETIHKLFGISSVIVAKKSSNADDIVIASRNLVEFLVKKGLRAGSKMRNAVDVPKWIFKKNKYMKAALRGLIDTDGSFYEYRHWVRGKQYHNFSMCFTSYSIPLLNSTYRILQSLGFKPRKYMKRVYLHKNVDIKRYFDIIGSHNPKHTEKYARFRAL